MSKPELLELLKLLSALESWSFASGQQVPKYLMEWLDRTIDELTKEVLR